MITGLVNSDHEAVVQLSVRGSDGRVETVSVIIDTGFNGRPTTPRPDIERLDLNWYGRGRAVLADGTEIMFDNFEVTVNWDGQDRRILVSSADSEPLLGMTLMDGYELHMQVRVGGQVSLTKSP